MFGVVSAESGCGWAGTGEVSSAGWAPRSGGSPDGVCGAGEPSLIPDALASKEAPRSNRLISAIKRLAIRGAPALGAAGALGVALAARTGDAARQAPALRAARPTAVNLGWGVDRALARLQDGADAVLAEALAILDEDAAAN